MIWDRVGIGWRPELAAGIVAHLNRIDVVEVIAEDYFNAASKRVRALAMLARHVPVMLHGTSQGLASTSKPERKRLENLARLTGAVEPESWSEHLAFVRAGGIEIGHLAAPPRCAATVDATASNLEIARKIVGRAPEMENIATLVDPPASDRDEPQWLADVVAASGCGLLLDLHNIYANGVNFGPAPETFLALLPLDRVRTVHISGGRVIGESGQQRILDDHLHDPPDPVYSLLSALAERCPNPLTVILERDGRYPGIQQVVGQLERARETLALGRTLAGVRRGAA